MAKKKITVWQFVCERCEHKWLPRDAENEEPNANVCPSCKSPYWNTPRKNAKVSEPLKKEKG